MRMTNGEKVLAVAAKDIGYRQEANKSNKFGKWYGMDKVPWCMEAVQYWYDKAGLTLPIKSASCGEVLRWYQKNQPACITKNPIPGCLVIFDFPGGAATDHVGLLESKSAATVTTIDGNTSNGNDANGGWVQRRTRALSYANPTYIVPRELKGEEDDDMKRYNTIDEIKKDAPWAVGTVEKLIKAKALGGNGKGLDLSEDMLRAFVINDRMGLYK